MQCDAIGLKERRRFIKYGQLGQLLFDPNKDESVRRCDCVLVRDDTLEEVVYDKKERMWVPYEEENIPTTYSVALRPESKAIELDYFLRSAPLINHTFIWTTRDVDGIERDKYAKCQGRLNLEILGRFTAIRALPTINNLARLVNGFVEQDQDDFAPLM